MRRKSGVACAGKNDKTPHARALRHDIMTDKSAITKWAKIGGNHTLGALGFVSNLGNGQK